MKAVKSLGNIAGFALTVCGSATVDGEPVGYDLDVEHGTAVIAGETDDDRVAHAFEAGVRARDVFAINNISGPIPPSPVDALPLLKDDGLPMNEDEPFPRGD